MFLVSVILFHAKVNIITDKCKKNDIYIKVKGVKFEVNSSFIKRAIFNN